MAPPPAPRRPSVLTNVAHVVREAFWVIALGVIALGVIACYRDPRLTAARERRGF
jgi:Asp/Glu/hydantoin racemase